MSAVLLTGCTGFVGMHLLKRFLQDGRDVIAMCRRADKLRDLRVSNSDQMTVFERDIEPLSDFDYDIDTIIHSAGQSPYNCINPWQYVEGNINLSRRIAEYSVEHGVSKVIYLSSLSVYGQVKVDIVDETTDIINPDMYGVSKWMAERFFEETAGDTACLSLRLPGVQGPGAWSTWMAGVLRKARDNDLIQAYNPDALFNNAVWIDDLYRFIVKLIDMKISGYDILTLGCREPIAIREVINTICRSAGSKSKINYMDSDYISFIISSEKARSRYGYESLTAREMLEKYIECELNQPVT